MGFTESLINEMISKNDYETVENLDFNYDSLTNILNFFQIIGIKNARGEYLAFVDGDDYISPYMIEHLYARIMQDQADVAVCGYKRVDEKGHELSTAMIPDSVVSGAEAIRMHYSHTAGIMMK